MSDSIATWRRRCIAAEERAAEADRSIRTLKAARKRARSEADYLVQTIDSQGARLAQSERVLLMLAKHHIGAHFTKDDVAALIARWLETADRLAEKKSLAKQNKDLAQVCIQISVGSEDLLRRLFPKREDDGEV